MRLALVVGLVAACGSSSSKQATEPPPHAQPVSPKPQEPPPKPAEPPPADPRIAADLATFDMVWDRVRETFYDPSFGGVDWNAVRTELRPKILDTKTREEARAIMNQALDKLGKSHFGVSGYLEEDPVEAKEEAAGIGIEVRILDGKAIVTRVAPGSPSDGKIKLGAELDSVGDKPLAPVIAKVAEQLGPSSLLPLFQASVVLQLMRGQVGTKARVGVVSAGRKRSVVIYPFGDRGTAAGTAEASETVDAIRSAYYALRIREIPQCEPSP